MSDLTSATFTASIVGTPTLVWSGGSLTVDQISALTAALVTGKLTFATGVLSNGGAQPIGYTYDPTAASLDFLRQGDTLTIGYSVQVSDGHVTTAPQPLNFVITGTNDQTVLTSVNSTGISTTVDELLGDLSAQDIAAITGSLAFSDKDIGDSLTASHGSPTVLINGAALTSVLSDAAAATLISALDHLSFGAGVTSNGGGTQNISWTWDPTAANLEFLNDGDLLTITYAVQVGDSATQNLTFTITGTTDALLIPFGTTKILSGDTLTGPIEDDGTIWLSPILRRPLSATSRERGRLRSRTTPPWRSMARLDQG